MENTISIGYVVEHLTKSEKARLKRMVLGYGNFRKAAIKSEVHINTLRNILDKGYGFPDTIQKVRQNLLNSTSKNAA